MKNKKSIAMAMAAVSTMGAVAPVFANQIVGEVTDIDLCIVNGKKSVWTQVGDKVFEGFDRATYSDRYVMQVKKNIEAVEEYLTNKEAELDENDNKKYTIKTKYVQADNDISQDGIQTGTVGSDIVNGGNVVRGYYEISIINNSDLTAAPENVLRVYGVQKDFGFGQELPAQSITLNYINGDVTKNDGTNDEILDRGLSLTNLNKKLDKVIYDLVKAMDANKITIIENLEANDAILDVYAGPIADPSTKVGTVYLRGIMSNKEFNKKDLKNIPTKNDFLNHWAEDAIVDAMINDIVDVSEAFRPEDGISRAEFAKIAVNAYGVSTTTSGTIKINFSDVQEKSWDYEYIMALATRGYIKGFEGKFRPEDKITREEAAVIVAKLEAATDVNALATEIETVTTDKNGNAVHKDIQIKGIEDERSIATWADESVKALLDSKVLTGYEENGKTYFKPANNIKRAEALVMMTRNK